MDIEITVTDIFDELVETVAMARTRALMGERQDALELIQSAFNGYCRFWEVLEDYPGHLALRRSFDETMKALRRENEPLIIQSCSDYELVFDDSTLVLSRNAA